MPFSRGVFNNNNNNKNNDDVEDDDDDDDDDYKVLNPNRSGFNRCT